MFPHIEISFDIVALSIALVGAFYWIWKHQIGPFFKWIGATLNSLSKIDAIHEQMFTNGGSTLRDAVNRIEDRIAIVENKQMVYNMDTKHGVFESNASGEYISVNRTLCRWLGRSEQEITGNGWLNSISEQDRHRVDSAWMYAIENDIEFDLTCDMVDSYGAVFKVRMKAHPVKKIKGQLLRYIGTVEKNG